MNKIWLLTITAALLTAALGIGAVGLVASVFTVAALSSAPEIWEWAKRTEWQIGSNLPKATANPAAKVGEE